MRKPRPVTRFLILVLAVQLLLPLVLYVARNRLMFFPGSTPAAAGLGQVGTEVEVRVVAIQRADGRELAAYDAIRHGVDPVKAPVVLFFHGNGGDIAMRARMLAELAAATDARVVMFDYSGYGGNAGSPSEDEVCIDGLAAYDWLIARGVPAERICLYGESLGGAVALHVATERPCAGVVAQSSFASLSSMAWAHYKWLPLTSLLTLGEFPSTERAAGLKVPLLVVHGDGDNIVPFSEGEKLHAAGGANAEFMPIRGVGHNDLFWGAGPAYLQQLKQRFADWTKPR